MPSQGFEPMVLTYINMFLSLLLIKILNLKSHNVRFFIILNVNAITT